MFKQEDYIRGGALGFAKSDWACQISSLFLESHGVQLIGYVFNIRLNGFNLSCHVGYYENY